MLATGATCLRLDESAGFEHRNAVLALDDHASGNARALAPRRQESVDGPGKVELTWLTRYGVLSSNDLTVTAPPSAEVAKLKIANR
jgi:hypothetical protein